MTAIETYTEAEDGRAEEPEGSFNYKSVRYTTVLAGKKSRWYVPVLGASGRCQCLMCDYTCILHDGVFLGVLVFVLGVLLNNIIDQW